MLASGYTSALLPLISYPQPTLPASIASAFDAARILNVRLMGLLMEIAPPPSAGFGPYEMPVVGARIDAETVKTVANAREIGREFEMHARERRLKAELRRVTCEALDAPGFAAEAARVFDLSIVPLAPSSFTDRELAEGLISGSGRPCLLLPHAWAAKPAPFDRVLVAWDGGRAVTRALSDALPLLQRAIDIAVVEVATQRAAHAHMLADVERWLSDHGVHARAQRLEKGRQSVAEVIDEAARLQGADLIVMGAFGHSRVRDFIVGGVTRSVLTAPRLPVFLSQ